MFSFFYLLDVGPQLLLSPDGNCLSELLVRIHIYQSILLSIVGITASFDQLPEYVFLVLNRGKSIFADTFIYI